MMDTTYNVGIYCRLSNDDERDGNRSALRTRSCCFKTMAVNRGRKGKADQCDSGKGPFPFWPQLHRIWAIYGLPVPSLGCRFIALNNGIDTMSDNGSTDVMCF